jgi:capsular exopolysaccharide synthesis family protein
VSRIYDALKRAADQAELPERPAVVKHFSMRPGPGERAAAVPEAYQRIVQGLLATFGSKSSYVMVVASALPGEGASTVARNVAQLLAQGAPTVLVDANLRAPSQHAAFGVPRDRGLAELLSGSARLEEVLKRLPSAGILSLVTSGAPEGNAALALGSEVARESVTALRADFRWVVVDTSPITAIAESGGWFGLADGVVLVVQASRTRWEAAEHALRIIEESGGRVLGAVLNRRKFYLPEAIYKRC